MGMYKTSILALNNSFEYFMTETNQNSVLIAEDDTFVLDMMSRMLTSAGFKVFQARDGLEAYETFVKHNKEIDLFVFDVVMPRMGGVQAYKAISLYTDGTLHQKVLYLTAFGADMLKSNNKDEFTYLLKPVDKTTLLDKIEEMLNIETKDLNNRNEQ